MHKMRHTIGEKAKTENKSRESGNMKTIILVGR